MTRRAQFSLVAIAAAGVLAAQLAFPARARAGQPSAATTSAYNEYLRNAEEQMQQDYRTKGAFISQELLDQPSAAGKLKTGQVLIRCVAGCDSSGVPVPGGLVHDWIGVVFIPGASLPHVLAMVEDYDHAADHYAPNVTRSRLLARSGDSLRVFLRLKQSEVVTVRFDTEYDVRYARLDDSRVYSSSHSTKVAQLAGGDRELPPDENDGFLWRLDSYWRFEQVAGGVYVQCRAISLSRSIPRGLGWIVAPFIRNIPRKSLQFTLGATRAALLSGQNFNRRTSRTIGDCHPEPSPAVLAEIGVRDLLFLHEAGRPGIHRQKENEDGPLFISG